MIKRGRTGFRTGTTMRDQLTSILQQILSSNARARKQQIVVALAAVVVFVTTYMLILPAISVERDKADEVGIKTETVQEQNEADASEEEEEEAASESAETAEPEKVKTDSAESITVTPADRDEKKTAEYTKKVEETLKEKSLTLSASQFYDVEFESGKTEEVEIELKHPLDVPDKAEIAVVCLGSDKAVQIKEIKTNKNSKGEVTSVSYRQKEAGVACVCIVTSDEAESEDDLPENNEQDKNPVAEEPAVADKAEESEEPQETDKAEKVGEPASEDASGEDVKEEAEVEQKTRSFSGSAGDVKVSVIAPEDAFPENTEMTVTPVAAEDILKTVENTINGNVTALKAVDITFYSEGRKVQPAKPIRVSLISGAVPALENPMVVHIRENGRGELIESAEADHKKMTFEADSFSVYAVVDGNTGDEARATVNFYGKDQNTPIATVYVKNSDDAEHLVDIVYDPGAGYLADGELFKGWSIDNPEYTAEQETKTIEDVRTYLEGLSITEGMEVNIYAMIFRAYNVQFKDEDGVTIHSETLINKTGEPITYNINTLYTPKSQDEAFQGWIPTTGSDKINPQKTIYQNGEEVKISGNVIFSPDAPSGYWLVFRENGSGVSYTAPQFIKSGDTPTEPPAPSRPGYEFGGWYTEPECTNEFDFTQELTARTTVYAKWTANPQATYTVIVWKQSVVDDYNAASDDKTYDFAFSKTLTVDSNTPVSALDLSAYTGLDGGSINVDGTTHSFYGFKYDTDKGIVANDTKVQPNGTTVVNIYYDREVVTYDFHVYDYTYTESSSTWSGNYYIPDGNGGYTEVYLYRNNGRWYRNRYITWGGWQYTDEYTGPVYTSSYYQSWHVRETFTGLYGQRLQKYGYTWPTDYRWFISNSQNETNFVSIKDMFEESANRNPSDEFHTDFYGRSSNFNTSVRHYLQNEDESWPATASYTIPTGIGNGMTFRTFSGFTASQFRIRLPNYVNSYRIGTSYDNNGNLVWTDWLDYGTAVDFDGNEWYRNGVYYATAGGIDFRYTRNKYNLTYMVGKVVVGDDGSHPVDEDKNPIPDPISGELNMVTGINYEASLASYAEGGDNYYEPDPQAGYYFAGWYIDSTCTTPADFENATMPLNGTIVYGKWVQKQYRVFMHPNVPVSDTSLDWGGQSMCFRVNDGEHIAGGNPIYGTRDDYELIGWYTDEACTKPFNFAAYVLNETTVKTDYDQTQSTEINDYGNPASAKNSDSENNRYWITKKLDLYAKWRAKLEGAKGINVVYNANGGSNAPTDLLQYLDSAQAVAGAASTPADPEEEHFLYWVVQTWDASQNKYVDTNVHAYPGDIFEVLKANAKRIDNPEWTGPNDVEHDQYIYTVQLRAEYGPVDEPTPTHITWYDNFTENPTSPDNYVTDNNLQINQAVDIEPPFRREGYRFLGWARVDTTDESGNPLPDYKLEPRNLDEDDLFLKYEDGLFKAEVNGTWTVVSQVAADEVYPYHDLYAVWTRAYPVTVIKHVEGADISTEFTFTPDFRKVIDSPYHTAFTLTGASGMNTKVFEDVPENSTFTIMEAEDEDFVTTVKYTVEGETTEHVVENGEEITVTGPITVEFTNTGKTYPVTVLKTDETTDAALPDAKFALTKKNDSDIYVVFATESSPDGIYYTNSDGEIELNLPAGDYQLREQEPPAGYIITNSIVQFTVAHDGTISVTSGDNASVDDTTLKIKNKAGTPLPHTGGPGNAGMTAIGLLLLLGGAVGLFLRRRIQEQ